MGGRDGGTEDGRPRPAAVSGAPHPALWDGRSPSAMKLELARGSSSAQRMRSRSAGELAVHTAAADGRARDRLTAAPTTEELGAGVAGARAAPARPRRLARDGRGKWKRAGGAGDWVGATEERRTFTAAVFGASHPALWVGSSPSAMKLELARVGAVRWSACGADLRGELAIHTAAAVTDKLAAGSTAAPTTEELGTGGESESCSGATTTARRRGGRLRQRTWGSSPSTTRPELARAGGRVAVRAASMAAEFGVGGARSLGDGTLVGIQGALRSSVVVLDWRKIISGSR
jgi:hypothetical protein